MEKSKYGILNFINNQKYILIIILIVSLIISYLIQLNSSVLGLDKDNIYIVEKEKPTSPMVIFTEYYNYIWYKKSYGSAYMSQIIGKVLENMDIEIFKENENKVETVPNPRQSNIYNYYKVRTLDPINKSIFSEKFEIEKKNFIDEELEIINDFRSSKNDNNLLMEREFNLFKIINAKIYLEEFKKISETTLGYAEDIIFKLNGTEKHNSNNIKLIKKEEKIFRIKGKDIVTVIGKGDATIREIVEKSGAEVDVDGGALRVTAPNEESRTIVIQMIKDIIGTKEKKLFYYPEIVILLLFISYFSLYFFLQLLKEND